MLNKQKGFDLALRKKAFIIAAVDVISICVAFFAALWLRFDFQFNAIEPLYLQTYCRVILPWCAISIGVFSLFGLYSSIWSFVSTDELMRVLESYLVLSIVAYVLTLLLKIQMPKSFYVMGLTVSGLFTLAIRFGWRMLRYVRQHLAGLGHPNYQENVLIIGAGEAGKALITEFTNSAYIKSRVCCLIDDNPVKWGKRLGGVPIVGGREEIPAAVEKYSIHRIIYAIPSGSAQTRKEFLDICSTTGCQVQVVPGMYQLVNGDISVSALRKVDVQDLLGRDPIKVNLDEILNFISGKVVMVTGGGGSIGSELCRQIAKSNPKQLIIFDIYENNAYDIQMELRRAYPDLNLVTLIGSVRNTARVDYVLDTYRPDLVFHAAAHKHVPLMEDSPNEAIKNNVFGTYKMARAAAAHGVKRFVLISTDKAVNPTNIMGASKRLCEMVVQMMNRQSDTEFVAVRFGNVLGSNGSVIPLFKKQIEAGGPVTVTDPRIIRYFMTIPEAVSLVLQAGYYAKGGEIFVLDMGEPVKIDDMARNLIRLSGYEPDVDIKIEYTGLRPGEKLYEELLMKEEGLQETANKLIHIGKPIEMDDELFKEQLVRLDAAYRVEATNMKELVAEIVPTYHPQIAVK
ncbi:MAG: polysaccharide biosynthesis protein [Oscillospiraceae bacterium]|nr:polysaccharide biosynthesis protein [Oscillospiraceae bacterium]